MSFSQKASTHTTAESRKLTQQRQAGHSGFLLKAVTTVCFVVFGLTMVKTYEAELGLAGQQLENGIELMAEVQGEDGAETGWSLAQAIGNFTANMQGGATASACETLHADHGTYDQDEENDLASNIWQAKQAGERVDPDDLKMQQIQIMLRRCAGL